MKRGKIVLLVAVVAAFCVFFIFDLGQYFSLAFFQEQRRVIEAFYAEKPLQTAFYYALLYVVVTGLSLPGAVPMTLAGGAIFGLGLGTILISFASTIGATLAFGASRYLFRDIIRHRFGAKIQAMDHGVKTEGAFYLFTLRLVPVFPFFMINLAMGLTSMSLATFFVVSQIGMLAGTLVYTHAGTQIAQLESVSGILSPGLMGAFLLLGVFPLLAKKMVAIIQARQVMAGYAKPKKFDRNLVVIGAGAAGLVTAYIAATVRAKVTLIEKHKMGGDCLNTGCVPSKALIRSAQFLAQARKASALGFGSVQVDFNFADVMERVQRVIKTVEPHDSRERYTQLGVECIQGEARITSPYTVAVNGQTLTTRSMVVATGSRPFIPDIPGIEAMDYLTSDTIWDLRQQPRHLLVLGDGPVGCELAQCFVRLGCQVTMVVYGERILIREDPEISALVLQRFREEGMQILAEHTLHAFRKVGDEKQLLCQYGCRDVIVVFDQLLVAAGRRASVSGFGLETLGIALNEGGTIAANPFLQTRFPNIFVCGDVTGPYSFTHTAAHQAWYAAVNALFGKLKKFRVDYSVIPWSIFTDPEVARVGLNELEARQKGIPYEVTTYGIDDLDRAIADEEAHGLVKILTVPGKDKILGVTIVGSHAGEIIAEYVLAMRHGLGLNKILGTIHIYPTMAEANKFAAGNWKKNHKPETLLRVVEGYHRWQRG